MVKIDHDFLTPRPVFRSGTSSEIASKLATLGGSSVVMGRDATGLFNQAVWNALSRKGLTRADWPRAITLTPEGLAYDTSLAGEILHSSEH